MNKKPLKELLNLLNKILIDYYRIKENKSTYLIDKNQQKLIVNYIVVEKVLKEWSKQNLKHKKILKKLEIKLK